MKNYSKVAVASCAFVTLFACNAVQAQTRVTASQLRAAQIRASQQRSIQVRRPQVRTVVRPSTTNRTATRSTTSATKQVKDKIPEAALLTERGSELVSRLKSLRYAESQMGSRHPSLESVRDEIASVKEQLQAWVPAVKTKNEDAEKDDVETAAKALADLSEDDLRQLVIRLSLDIHKLRNRVVELESTQKKISSLVVDRK